LFKIEEQYSEYIDYCINQLIDDYHKTKNVKKIFDEFINNYIYSNGYLNFLCPC